LGENIQKKQNVTAKKSNKLSRRNKNLLPLWFCVTPHMISLFEDKKLFGLWILPMMLLEPQLLE